MPPYTYRKEIHRLPKVLKRVYITFINQKQRVAVDLVVRDENAQ